MEIVITNFFNSCNPSDYSASIMEKGSNAGKITWNNAVGDASIYDLLDTEEKRIAFRKHIAQFGAWDEKEINAWNDNELNALFMQCICAEIRESMYLDNPVDHINWEEYDNDENEGHRIFKGMDNEIYYIAE